MKPPVSPLKFFQSYETTLGNCNRSTNSNLNTCYRNSQSSNSSQHKDNPAIN